MLEKLKSIGLKIGFALSALATLVLLILFDKQKRKLADLRLEADRRELKKRIENIQEKSQKSDKDYVVAHRQYLQLRRSVPKVFDKLRDDTNKPDGGDS